MYRKKKDEILKYIKEIRTMEILNEDDCKALHLLFKKLNVTVQETQLYIKERIYIEQLLQTDSKWAKIGSGLLSATCFGGAIASGVFTLGTTTVAGFGACGTFGFAAGVNYWMSDWTLTNQLKILKLQNDSIQDHLDINQEIFQEIHVSCDKINSGISFDQKEAKTIIEYEYNIDKKKEEELKKRTKNISWCWCCCW